MRYFQATIYVQNVISNLKMYIKSKYKIEIILFKIFGFINFDKYLYMLHTSKFLLI